MLNFQKIMCFIVLMGFTFSVAYSQKLTQSEKWELKLKAYEKKDSLNPPPNNHILFIGSSTVENWRSLEKDFSIYNVLNRGVSGTKMVDLYHFRERLISPYHPTKIFIYEGDNDIALGWSPDSIRNVFIDLFHYIREQKPDATIYMVSIKPSPSRLKYKDSLLRTNKLLKDFIEKQNNAGYIDVYTPMLRDGEIVPDYYREDKLHLTSQGYEIWRQEIGPYIKKQAK